MDPLIRRLYDAPEPPEESPEQEAARREAARLDLHARIDADIAEGRERMPRELHGVIHFPAAMLDAFGLTEMDEQAALYLRFARES